MEGVPASNRVVATLPCSTLRAPRGLSFGDGAAGITFASAPKGPIFVTHASPPVHQVILLHQQSGCMQPSPTAPAATSEVPLLPPADRGASHQSLPVQLPSALPFERNAYNFATQQHDTHVEPCACMNWSPRADTYVFCENVVESPDSLMCDACSTGAIPCECTCDGCRRGDCEAEDGSVGLTVQRRRILLRRLQHRRQRVLWQLQRRRRHLAILRCAVRRRLQRRRRAAQ